MPKLKFPMLHTERLTLREMQKSDAEALVAILRDHEVTRYLHGNLSALTLKQERGYIRSMRKQFLQGGLINWLICDKATGAVMGAIGLQPINRIHNCANAGFFLGLAHWGKGYMTEAFVAVLDYAFDVLNLNRVAAGHYAGNEASGRVQQKCGLRYEGTHRQAFLKNGEYVDELMYAMVREDWENSRRAQ
ncbi:MAG: GNAT family N-acetyltransferase [Oscillospiraceae bacterium]|nr:GNAT family N-acetyltransferase [Oscillospiraceae bacterium]